MTTRNYVAPSLRHRLHPQLLPLSMREHKPECKQLIAATCAIPIECPHGYDCCPVCDPCECFKDETIA